MAKKKKKQNNSLAPVNSAGAAGKKKFSVKRALLIFISTIAAFTLYQTVNILEANAHLPFPIITTVFFVLATLLFCLIFFFNRGFSTKPVTVEMLMADGVAPEDAEAVCEKLNSQKKIAKVLMLILLPIVFTILLDMIYLFYGDFFLGALKYITGAAK